MDEYNINGGNLKLKLNPFTNDLIDVPYKDKETYYEILCNILNELKIPVCEETLELFTILVEGKEIPQEHWVWLSPTQNLYTEIVVTPKNKEFGKVLGSIALLATTVLTTSLAPGAIGTLTGLSVGSFGNAFLTSLAAGTASYFTGAIVNALIPPEDQSSKKGAAKPEEESQMYSFSSQSNTTSQYGLVPKVYGRHRMFPKVCATPYTTVEEDSAGEYSQFYHAIYDFGLGPCRVSEIKIGETYINNYQDIGYNLVDINKPSIAEGSWDDDTIDEFLLYNGDNNVENVGVNLTGSLATQEDSTTWEIERTLVASNTYKPSISTTLGFLSGLNSFNEKGEIGTSSVDFQVEFAVAGTKNWRNASDLSYVSQSARVSLPDFATDNSNAGRFELAPFTYSDGDNISNPPSMDNYDTNRRYSENTFGYSDWSISEDFHYEFGWNKGKTFITTSSPVPEGVNLYYGSQFLGKVTSSPSIGGGLYNIFFESGIPKKVVIGTFTASNFSGFEPNGDVIPSTITEFPSSNKGNYTIPSSIVSIQASRRKAFYCGLEIFPKNPGQYKVRVRKINQSYQYANPVSTASDLTVINFNLKIPVPPINTTKRHVFLEIKVKASNQLNGAISNLNAIVESVLPVYSGGSWTKEISRNPAWVFADLLTGEVNKNAVSYDRLDTTALVEWADYCDEVPTSPPGFTYAFPRFESNFVLDFQTTLQEILNKVANMSQASLNLLSGKYGVVLDKSKSIPTQVFTPRNSSNFSSKRSYPNRPQAFKVTYIDVEKQWQQSEVTVYDDGYNESNVEINKIEQLNTFAITRYEQAWRYGRYHLAQSRLRQENITIDVDFEYLACSRGDYVLYVQDVMRVGGTAARVTSVSGSDVTIDDSISAVAGESYGYTLRTTTGITTSTLTFIDSDTFTVDGTIPSVGDLIVVGIVDSITFDCIVKEIRPSTNLTATLTLVEKNNEIFEAESSLDLPDYDPNLNPYVGETDTAPGEVNDLEVTENTFTCTGINYEYFVRLNWSAPSVGVTDAYEVYVDFGDGYDFVTTTTQSSYRYIVSTENLGEVHNFKILAVSANGSKITLGSVSSVNATPTIKSDPPSDVEALYINVTDQTLTLDWPQVRECDIDEYLIRYSPNNSAIWSNTVVLSRVDARTTSTTIQARTGKYFIKAIDFNGNESDNAAIAITTIPELPDLNFIDETDDFPLLEGSKERVVDFGGSLVLQEENPDQYHSDGNYYYSEFLDLGDVYTVRLQSLVQAEGFSEDDLMVNWTTLASVDALSSANYSDWDVEVYARSTDVYPVMSNWTTLTSVNIISEGVAEDWTDYRKFTIGDFTGRIFQYRVRLRSFNTAVTPRVFESVIRADMPTRTESENNVTVGVGGTTFTFPSAFYGPSSDIPIRISQDNAQQGDYYNITSKSTTGFTIIMYDSTGTSVSRQIDYAAQGWGKQSSTSL